jgi:nucleoside-diphosphate-sugar epimerase
LRLIVLIRFKGILNSAAREPSVKRFVYTSSSQAASDPIPNKEFIMDSNTWHDSCIEEAWAPPPYGPERAWPVYAASKTQAEKALWQFAKEQKPGFVVNSILPNANFGTILAGGEAVTTAKWVKSLYDGDINHVKGIPPRKSWLTYKIF